jgi:hypothetical protein
MKRIFAPLFLLALLAFFSCKKDNTTCLEGEITGFDYSKCGCCWGWWFQAEGKSQPYLIGEIPNGARLPDPGELSASYPIKVRVEFEKHPDCFDMTRRVIATKVELR